MPDREKVFADIDVQYSQLARLKPSSKLASTDFKTKFNSLAHTFSGCLLRLKKQDGETSIAVLSNRCEITII